MSFNFHNPLTLKVESNKESQGNSKSLEDELLEQDIEGSVKKAKNVKRRIKLNYDSDSSDEDYKDMKEKDEEIDKNGSDEDMFVSDVDEGKEVEETNKKKVKKQVEFLNVDEFNQEMGLSDNGSQHDDVEDIEDAEGEENETGQFDIDGNYIRNDDEEEEKEANKDSWLADLKKSDIIKAKKSQDKARAKMLAASQNEAFKPIEQLIGGLIELLKPVETPLESLQALNTKHSKWKNKNQKKNKILEDDKEVVQQRKAKIEEITLLCNKLIDKGVTNIYDLTREELIRKYKEESGEDYKPISNGESGTRGVKRKLDNLYEQKNDEETQSGSKDIKYEFKYIGHDEVYGPYSADDIRDWKDNHFEKGTVLIKKINEDYFKILEDEPL
ncbi:hypothetical protein PACTADRAFT_47610 [Pachysolen tannophilus NRRL Y-2460]|uniref:GYF domain-containing protein n=1 Tax=Pachysolen tannophilus NRRL Y-2460 TaxID=669874 RepID=A0A1E4U173_PACTA|nr:hypothetical protein PACTADRAFT_47610 [Pachysolen tannophilus NRRL Y-2460]